MNKPRKICCRITPGRVMGTVVVAVCAVNLIIVGAAFEVTFPDPAPTSTVTLQIDTVMGTFFPVTATEGETSTATLTSTETATQTSTSTPTLTFTPTSTDTASPTSTATTPPTRISCAPRTYWPVYIVRRGNTLSSLAIATGSTVHELMLANCLPDTRIIAGEPLYVPRLPIPTATATPTATNVTITPTYTPSNTPVTPSNTPADFEPAAMSCDYPRYVSFSVAVYDPEGVVSVDVTVNLSNENEEGQITLAMNAEGDMYFASGNLPEQYTVFDVVNYTFRAEDRLGNVTPSQAYEDRSSNCSPLGWLLSRERPKPVKL